MFLGVFIGSALLVGTLGALIYFSERTVSAPVDENKVEDDVGGDVVEVEMSDKIAVLKVGDLIRVMLNDKAVASEIIEAINKGPLPATSAIGAVNLGSKENPDWYDLSFMHKDSFYRSKLGGLLLNLKKQVFKKAQPKTEISEVLHNNPEVTNQIKEFVNKEHSFPEFTEE